MAYVGLMHLEKPAKTIFVPCSGNNGGEDQPHGIFPRYHWGQTATRHPGRLCKNFILENPPVVRLDEYTNAVTDACDCEAVKRKGSSS
jgi:hypothetical protein